MELKLEGGESSSDAMKRIVEVVENTFIVTHGNLISLLLKRFNKDFVFNDWKNLSNPDVFLLDNEKNKMTIERL